MEDYKKKYEDLMKNIEHLHESVNPEWKRTIEYYIPELMSKDERVRKNLREFLLDAPSQDIVDHHLDLDETLNWLEKQGKQNPTWSEEDEKKIELLIAIFEVNHPNEYFKVNPINTLNMEAMSTEEIVDWLKSLKKRMKRK